MIINEGALPTVAVVICNYNYGHLITEALDSVLGQDLPPAQVIVVDDGSTDDSLARIQPYLDRIELIAKKNEGQVSAYNVGFAKVRSDIVIFLDSDDKLAPAATMEVSKVMRNEKVGRVHYQLSLLNVDGAPSDALIPTHMASGDLAARVKRGILFLASPGSGNAYRTETLRKLMPLPVPEGWKHGADFLAGYGCALIAEVAALKKPLGYYRIHNTESMRTLHFGNARLKTTGAQMIQARYAHFSEWISKTLPGTKMADHVIVDFSLIKKDYASSIIEASNYWDGVRAGVAQMRAAHQSIVYRDSPVYHKLALIAWLWFTLLAPRMLGARVARFVCNPSSRMS